MKKQGTNDLQISPGKPWPFGATSWQDGFNFAIAAKEAQQLFLCLFNENNLEKPFKEIALDPILNKTGDVWHIHVKELAPFTIYGYRLFPKGLEETSYLVVDPYTKLIASHATWRSHPNDPYRPLGKILSPSNFDWQGDTFPRIPTKDLILYEMHIRGFTIDSNSQVQHPGTFLGVLEKIHYLKELGVNALEIMPVYEFNENEALQVHPKTKEKLCNYFGYSPVNFFSPMIRYASQTIQDKAAIEFKTMVRELHKNGIEVILDVVYNHTFEGNQMGPTLSFRGLNQQAYYMMDGQGNYLNFSGCGNTLNTNHPWTRELILESLRYWVIEMHIDGFRFDLASILTRAENGTPLGSNVSIVEAISSDPILSQTKLIAEAWDAGGLYQVGGFYPGTRWLEWNGHYRDVVRRFIKGTSDYKAAFATALCGSQDLYGWGRAPTCSVNFITAHDGFSLADLVTYNEKHNEDNGENNQDGFNHNDSWNCGIEGHSSNKKIVYLRERQIRNFHLALMISQGVPMILMGDEYAHTRHGNNNTWCQDNALNWFLWDRLEVRPGFHRFFRLLIQFRKMHPQLSKDNFLEDKDITWHGLNPFNPDWGNDNRFVAFTLNFENNPNLYIAFNAAHTAQTINIPSAGQEKQWQWIVNTHNPPPDDFFDEEHRQKLLANTYRIPSYSAIMLEAKSMK